MTSNWEVVRLGDVAVINPENTSAFTADRKIRYVDISSVSAESGIASDSLMELAYGDAPGRARRAIRSGDVLVSTVRPNLRAFAQVPAELDGQVASTGFTVLRAVPGRALADYIWASIRTEQFVVSMVEQATGSNYPAIRPQNVSDYTVLLPPLPEQRRIVDLIGALDEAIEAADENVRASGDALNSFLDGIQVSSTRRLGDRATLRSGPSWKSANETTAPTEGGEPVLGITNTPAGRSIDLTVEKYVSGLPKSTMRATENSIVMIRTNGNRSRIGNVYRATKQIKGFAVSAFQILIEPNDDSDAELIFWSLCAPSVQQQISEAASGSTGLGNVAIGWLKNLALPLLEGSEGADFLSTVDALDTVVQSCRENTESLRALRSEMLTSLLSGAHTIPESYDKLLDAVDA